MQVKLTWLKRTVIGIFYYSPKLSAQTQTLKKLQVASVKLHNAHKENKRAKSE